MALYSPFSHQHPWMLLSLLQEGSASPKDLRSIAERDRDGGFGGELKPKEDVPA